MKYLKHINETVFQIKEVEEAFSPHINWKLIQDVKDMALEYIDDGMFLRVRVSNSYHSNFLTADYDHKGDKLYWFQKEADPTFIKDFDFIYKFELLWGQVAGFINRLNTQNNYSLQPSDREVSFELKKYSIYANHELSARIKQAYPNENIKF